MAKSNKEIKEREMQKQIDDLIKEKKALEEIIEKENNINENDNNLNSEEILNNLNNLKDIKTDIKKFNKNELITMIKKLSDK